MKFKILLSSLVLVASTLFGLTEAKADNPDYIVTVDTFSQLQTFHAGAPYNKTVYLKGYNSTNDGGQGFWNWDSVSTKTPNICDTVQAVANSTPVVTGRWRRQVPGNVLNIDMCGARLSTDASVPFAAAMALCQSMNYTVTASGGAFYYIFQHNITIPAICSFLGAPNSIINSAATKFLFTNDTDGGYCITIGNTSAINGNVVGNFFAFGNLSGVPSQAHCGGIFVNNVASLTLQNVSMLYFNGPCLLMGNGQDVIFNNISMGICGGTNHGEFEIDGSLGTIAPFGNGLYMTNITIESSGTANSTYSMMIDNYSLVSWLYGDAENAGTSLGLATKTGSQISNISIEHVDFEHPTGSSMFVQAGTGWSGSAGNAVINLRLVDDTFVADSEVISSAFVVKESTNFFAEGNLFQASNANSVVFDFQGSHNFNVTLGANYGNQLTTPFTYLKVNGSTISDTTPNNPWWQNGATCTLNAPYTNLTFVGGFLTACTV